MSLEANQSPAPLRSILIMGRSSWPKADLFQDPSRQERTFQLPHCMDHKVFFQQCGLKSFLFSFFCFLGPNLRHMEVPRLGVKSELQLPATPQPQQLRIQVTSATYITAYSNTRSLIHWARPGIEPSSPWMLARFVTAKLQWKLLLNCSLSFFFLFFFFLSFLSFCPF